MQNNHRKTETQDKNNKDTTGDVIYKVQGKTAHLPPVTPQAESKPLMTEKHPYIRKTTDRILKLWWAYPILFTGLIVFTALFRENPLPGCALQFWKAGITLLTLLQIAASAIALQQKKQKLFIDILFGEVVSVLAFLLYIIYKVLPIFVHT